MNKSPLHEVRKIFNFEAAHRLPKLAPTHKCSRLHGHSYKVTLIIRGELLPEMGWVMDFAEIKRIFSPILELLDHHYLNEVPGLENPTSEVLAHWIYNQLSNKLAGLHQVIIAETCTSETAYPV